MLGPADGTVERRQTGYGFGDPDNAFAEFDSALEADLRERQQSPHHETRAGCFDLVWRYRAFAMDADSGRGLFRRRAAEDIEAEVVAQDPREQRVGVSARGRLDGWPRRGPKRIHSGGFVQDLGDVPAFPHNGDTEVSVLYARGLPPS